MFKWGPIIGFVAFTGNANGQFNDGSCVLNDCQFFSDQDCTNEERGMTDAQKNVMVNAFKEGYEPYLGQCYDYVAGGCKDGKFRFETYMDSPCRGEPIAVEETDLFSCQDFGVYKMRCRRPGQETAGDAATGDAAAGEEAAGETTTEGEADAGDADAGEEAEGEEAAGEEAAGEEAAGEEAAREEAAGEEAAGEATASHEATASDEATEDWERTMEWKEEE